MTQHIAIAGFGAEGQSTYRFLQSRTDAVFHILDDKEVEAPDADVVMHMGTIVPEVCDVVYKAPGVLLKNLICVSPETVISSLTNLFFEEMQGQVIGITGTKGKSTVASLVHHILIENGKESVLVGNIGIPALDALDGDTKERIYVYEMSSFQCELLQASPQVAVLTNVFAEHLDHHGSFETYREAKLNIARFQEEEGLFVCHPDIEISFKGRVVHPRAAERFETNLVGEHNQYNCACATEAVRAYGISEEDARDAIKTFKPLPHRLELVGEMQGITFYDDALATIPEATLASIEALGDVDTLILGGVDRGISFDSFAESLAKTAIKTFIIFPDTGVKMVMHVSNRRIIPVETMEEAVRAAYAYAQKVCLLSNASPSYNLFVNYKDKARHYRYWIEELG